MKFKQEMKIRKEVFFSFALIAKRNFLKLFWNLIIIYALSTRTCKVYNIEGFHGCIVCIIPNARMDGCTNARMDGLGWNID